METSPDLVETVIEKAHDAVPALLVGLDEMRRGLAERPGSDDQDAPAVGLVEAAEQLFHRVEGDPGEYDTGQRLEPVMAWVEAQGRGLPVISGGDVMKPSMDPEARGLVALSRSPGAGSCRPR